MQQKWKLPPPQGYKGKLQRILRPPQDRKGTKITKKSNKQPLYPNKFGSHLQLNQAQLQMHSNNYSSLVQFQPYMYTNIHMYACTYMQI